MLTWIFLLRLCEANRYNFEEHLVCTITNFTKLKRGAYLKLGTNSSIYSKFEDLLKLFTCDEFLPCFYR